VPERLFTVDEANAALVFVRPLVERLVEYRADLLAAQARLAELAAEVAGNGGGIDPGKRTAYARTAASAEERIRETAASLDELGVVVKDLDAGLVDFPAERDGRRVFLCWQLGEERVAYWHGLEDGFAGRNAL
jgi:hypothetical protein